MVNRKFLEMWWLEGFRSAMQGLPKPNRGSLLDVPGTQPAIDAGYACGQEAKEAAREQAKKYIQMEVDPE